MMKELLQQFGVKVGNNDFPLWHTNKSLDLLDALCMK